jgi:hypothetical protein
VLFNSLTFYEFFAIMLALHDLPFSWRVKKFNLLVGSYISYAARNPPLVLPRQLQELQDFFETRFIAQ